VKNFVARKTNNEKSYRDDDLMPHGPQRVNPHWRC